MYVLYKVTGGVIVVLDYFPKGQHVHKKVLCQTQDQTAVFKKKKLAGADIMVLDDAGFVTHILIGYLSALFLQTAGIRVVLKQID